MKQLEQEVISLISGLQQMQQIMEKITQLFKKFNMSPSHGRKKLASL